MKTILKPVAIAKNHVIRNRGKYAFAAGLSAGLYVNAIARNDWNAFLAENDLTEKFYTPPE